MSMTGSDAFGTSESELDPACAVEATLLRDALELDGAATIEPAGREPFGNGAVAGFDVRVLQDKRALRYYVDTSGLPVAQETGMVLGGTADPQARIWLHPADPHLPALPAIAFHDAAQSLLARLGIEGRPGAEFVGYRPGRRAVLRIETASRPVWAKVLRPSRVERIVRVHEACAKAGLPVPKLAGWSPEGVLLLASAEGVPAPDALWDPQALLERVQALRVRIATVAVGDWARGVADRLDWYRDRLVELNDAQGQDRGGLVERVERIVSAVRRVFAETVPGRPLEAVHGDLHFGQLFLDEAGEISGLIDVDTLGLGDPAEDPAAFMAHATVSALFTPPVHRARVWALADGAMQLWGADPMVRGLLAVHMLGHALAAVDRSDARLAGSLLGAAEAVLRGEDPSSCG